jgi:drug/metabolite transporter (DMT)-like permease
MSFKIGILAGFLSMLGWGIGDFLAAKSSRKIGFISTLFFIQIIGFFLASVYFSLNFSTLNINSLSRFFITLFSASFLILVATLAFYKGLEKGKVSLVSPISSSFPIITVILSVIFLGEVLKPNQIIAIFLISLGIVLASINIKELTKIKKITIFLGVKEGLITMLGWGIGFFLIVNPSKNLGWFLSMFTIRLFILILLTIYLILSKHSLKTNFYKSFLFLLLFAGVLTLVADFSYSFGVHSEYASIVAPVSASYPLVTIILAKIFLKEKLALNQIFGIVSVIVGLILISI